MSIFLDIRGAVRRSGLVALAAVLLGGWLPGTAHATHLRAGDIQAAIDTTASANPLRVFFRMTIYRDRSGMNAQQLQDQTTVFFGDGTSATGTNGPNSPVVRTVNVAQSTADTEVLVFAFEHTYAAAFSYTVSFVGENRNDGVLNMTLSREQSFYIETRITLDPAIRRNHSPQLLAPAYDKAATGQVFLHNPAAYDADGDSLAFELIDCRQVPLGVAGVVGGRPNAVRCTNYISPIAVSPSGNQVAYAGPPAAQVGAPSIFEQNGRTGQIVWNAPNRAGLYNIAFRVRVFRRTRFGFRELGFVVRDMQIIVVATPNLRPLLTLPPDVCVVAGQTVIGTVTAIDPTGPNAPASAMTLSAYGGMLPPATFVQTAAGPPRASGTFRWTTQCGNVASDPYQVVFKVQDETGAGPGDPPSLIDQGIWRITVVGPPPQNLTATPGTGPAGNTATLSWNRYTCTNADTLYIYRKEDPSSFVPGPCETGIPPTAGYTRIGRVAVSALPEFIDRNGLARGKTYCYRIYAGFPLPAGGASIASAEACATFAGRAARLKNVDVERTDANNGQIAVRWTTARSSGNQPLNGPGGYRLYRAAGQSPAPTDFQLIRTFNSITDDSVMVDTGLNTLTFSYTYRLELFYAASAQPGAATLTEAANPASSVRLAVAPNGLARTNALTWTYQVPWDNAPNPVAVFRRLSTATAFTRLPAAPATGPTGGSYLDNDPALQQGQTYCYYVQTTGRYLTPGTTTYLNNLMNRSQELCAELVEVPCQPVLTLLPPNCDSIAALPDFPAPNQTFVNRLRWTAGTAPAGCSAPVSYYRIFFRPTAAGLFVLLDSTQAGSGRLSYDHRNLPLPGGCYAVQAVAPNRVRSPRSNEVCQQDCPAFAKLNFFELPNVFTPNGDAFNQVFQPKRTSAVRSVNFRAYNRWGVKVFENQTTAAPFINWDSTGRNGEQGGLAPVSGGVYFYLAEVEFADANSTRRTYKGWVEIIK